MIHHFELRSFTPGYDTLILDWNDETGEVTGPGAAIVMEMATWPCVELHPLPGGHTLGPDPLRSKRDMAAILGSHWHCPRVLIRHYPRVRQPRNMPPGVTY